MDSIYWVVSRDCNQQCAHCYNDSRPGAPGLAVDDIERVVSNLPDPRQVSVERIILSGGEVLVWPELLFEALDRLQVRYGHATRLWIQTNGDLLDDAMLDRLLAAHVERIDVASMDRFHHRDTLARKDILEDMFQARGMVFADTLEEESQLSPPRGTLLYHFWGANPESWIGPLWPRGRARKRNLSKAGPEDRFCSLWSGALNFLNYHDSGSEVNVQLADVYPCCPMTIAPLGSLLDESLLEILDRAAEHPVFQALNAGSPEAMGVALGISEEMGWKRSQELGNHCLWCDEFFEKHAPELLQWAGPTVRGVATEPV